MKALLIDTASEPAIVAVVQAGIITARAEITERRRISESLLKQVDAVLRQSGQTVQSLDVIGVVNGPGSFTGLRIGIATANALAAAAELPMVAISADQVSNSKKTVTFVADQLEAGNTASSILPNYGREPSITLPKA